jgi:hypothetical protein
VNSRPIILRRTDGGPWKPLMMGDWNNGNWIAGFDPQEAARLVAYLNGLHEATRKSARGWNGIELKVGF